MCLEFTVIAYSWSCMTITNRIADAITLGTHLYVSSYQALSVVIVNMLIKTNPPESV